MLDKNKIQKILVVSLSNIGDIILTFPVIDILKQDFPSAQLDLIIGPKGASLFDGNPNFRNVFLYHKNQSPLAMIKWMRELAAKHYDLVIDLRNTAIPFLIFAKYKTPLMLIRPKGVHMRQQHLARLKAVYKFSQESKKRFSLDVKEWKGGIDRFVVMAPGSRAENKKWREDGFAKLADYLFEHYAIQTVLVGDENDIAVAACIKNLMKNQPLDLTGKLTLVELGQWMSKARLAVVNDSAPLHLASYLNVPVVAFFGPTDPAKYGPWSEKRVVFRNNQNCFACQGDKKQLHTCIEAISFDDTVERLEKFLPEILNGN